MSKINLSLVLPIHNQETIIEPVVAQINKVLTKTKISNEIILVENGSSDKTLTVLRELSKKHSNMRVLIAKKGYGSAVIKGLISAKGDYVAYMPSDGQLNPKLLSQLYKIINKNNYDLVKIKRTSRESNIRFLRSKTFNILSRLLFHIPVLDINGSPRIFLRNWLPILDLKYKDSFIDAEMAIKAYYLNWKIIEIPTPTLPRLGGKSTVSIKTVIEFLRNLFSYKIGRDLSNWLKKTKKLSQTFS